MAMIVSENLEPAQLRNQDPSVNTLRTSTTRDLMMMKKKMLTTETRPTNTEEVIVRVRSPKRNSQRMSHLLKPRSRAITSNYWKASLMGRWLSWAK
jgi:hypothetical protein